MTELPGAGEGVMRRGSHRSPARAFRGARAPSVTHRHMTETDQMHHIHEKGTTVKPTERTAKSAFTPKTGISATLRVVLHISGTSAPKTKAGLSLTQAFARSYASDRGLLTDEFEDTAR